MRLFVGVCLATIMSFCAVAQTTIESPELFKKNQFDIGGRRRMNMVCIGEGSPTVVFDYGLAGHLLHWQKVQAPVSAFTRACFYDRAGYGYSDPSPRPLTAENVVDDLHALLEKAGIEHVVLVGHSIGGLYATLYADKYLDQVAGLVLIDPSYAGLERMDRMLTPDEQQKIKAAQDEEIAAKKHCADLARAGALTAEDPHDCFQFAPGRTSIEKAYLADQFTKPFRYEAAISEQESFDVDTSGTSIDSRQEFAAARPFGNIPLIVLTRGVADTDSEFTPQEQQAAYNYWKQSHDKLAARSTRGQSIVVPNSSHFVQNDQPQAVIDAIRKVVDEVRTTSP
jgi:pimeloyl-ACP methyl ester carboxylesterase